MACVVLRDGASLTPAELGAFLAGQGDLGPKQYPRFVRVTGQMPRTATFKVLTRLLAAGRWNTSDPVWWRPDPRSLVFVPLDPQQAAELDAGIRAARPDASPGRPA
jgi:fatty-acyl-CoA synthase